MQPENQQGFYQPGQGQPVAPGAAPQPPVSPQPTPPPAQGIAPVVDQAALQAALNEPAAATPVAAPAPNATPPVPAPTPQQQAPAAPVVQTQVAQQQPITAEPPFEEQQYDDDVDEEFADDGEAVSWVAQEYIHQEKGAVWFILFGVIILALIGLSIFTQAWTFTALIVVMAVVVIVYSRRPPRELTYTITDDGLSIDSTLHKFSSFKSFGIVHDGQEFSVMLIPTQRFQPGISVYFPEEAGEEIVDMLGSRLPMKDLKLDMVDRVVRLLRL